jgi:hypothetical protein
MEIVYNTPDYQYLKKIKGMANKSFYLFHLHVVPKNLMIHLPKTAELPQNFSELNSTLNGQAQRKIGRSLPTVSVSFDSVVVLQVQLNLNNAEPIVLKTLTRMAIHEALQKLQKELDLEMFELKKVHLELDVPQKVPRQE